MLSSCHIPFRGFRLSNVNDLTEQECFSVLPAEVLSHSVLVLLCNLKAVERNLKVTHPTHDILLIRKVCLTVFTPIDALAV